MRSKFDNPTLGVIMGIIFPFIGFYIFYELYFETLTFREFIDHILRVNKIAQVISLSVISNLAVFFFFIWKKFYFSARGVLLATLLYTLVVVVQKFMN